MSEAYLNSCFCPPGLNYKNPNFETELAGVHLTNYAQTITMRLTLRGFVVHDFANDEKKRSQFRRDMLSSGILESMKGQDTVVPASVEEIPKVWLGLFEGVNRGKLITKLHK